VVGYGGGLPVQRALVGAVAALALLTAGCTTAGSEGGSTRAASSSSPSASTSTEPVTLRVSVYGDPQTVTAYRRMAESYTDEHPEVTIEVEATADARAAQQRLSRQLAAGDPPDVFLADHAQVPDLVAKGRVHPIDELLEKRGVLFGDNFQRLGLEAFSADSALQCMPQDVSPLVVFYNKRLVRPRTVGGPGEDPPTRETGWTWQQFTTAARRASGHGVKGFYMAPGLDTLLPLVRSAGADLVDDDRQPTTLKMSDDSTRQALAQILPVLRDRQLTPSAAEVARQSPLQMFEDGHLAMLVGTRKLVPKLREAGGLSFDVYPLPKLGSQRTVAEVSGYCISSTTRHLEPAADFVAFATGAEGARIIAGLGGVVPANLAALHSEAFLQPGSQPRHAEVFSDVLRRADALPFSTGWPALEREEQPLLEQLVYRPRVDLARLLPRMDSTSQLVLAPPSPSASPSQGQ
jgi:multiple sugar transport system substrate-binding protein